MGNVMVLVEGSAYRPSSRVTPLSSFFVANLFIEDDKVFGFLWEEAWPPAVGAAFGVTIAVALATLPLKSLLAGAGDTLLAGVAAADAGLLAGFVTAAAVFFTGLGAGLATVDFTAGLPRLATACFDTGLAAATFLTTAFFGAALPDPALVGAAFFGAGFFAVGGAGLAFLTGALAIFLATAGLATGFFAAALLAGLAARADLAAGLATFFTAGALPALAFDLPPLASAALAAVFPLCALVAVELALVFAISLHRGWPWRPRVIADVFYTIKPASGILVPSVAANRLRQGEHSDPIDTVDAPFVQALDQSIARQALSFLPQLLRLCTDGSHPLRPMARQPADWLAPVALPALVRWRRGPGTRAFPLCTLPRPRASIGQALRPGHHDAALRPSRHGWQGRATAESRL